MKRDEEMGLPEPRLEEVMQDVRREEEERKEREGMLAYLITHRPGKPTEPRKEGSC